MNRDIDEICVQYEADLKVNGQQSLLPWIVQANESQQCVVFQNLLEIELEYLFRLGRQPVAEVYAREYPEFVKSINPAFDNVRRRLAQESRVQVDGDSETWLPEISESKTLKRASVVLLRVTAGPTAGKDWEFSDHQTFVAGRSPQAHLRLSPNPTFSRFHCRLEINPPRAVIVDLDSTNGTRVNGKRIESAVLKHGDEVSAGDVRFRILIKDMTHARVSAIDDTYVPSCVTAAKPDAAIPPSLCGYRIEKKLGQGAMGVVYQGRRIATNSPVAIKLVLPSVAADRRSLDRFRREACIILRLQHKRIVRCLDFGFSEDHLPYLVMEFIPELKPREIFSDFSEAERIRVSVATIVRVLEGIQYAHDAEIVHRDLKPSNLLMFRSGRKLQVKVADFGLAKNFVDAGFSDCSVSNELCGTIAYMAPEQVIDCRYAKPPCDIYSAGVCLYNLITGRLPFEADVMAQQIALILNGSPVPVQEFAPSINGRLAQVIRKAIDREPANRFESAEAMRRSLIPFAKRP